MDVDAVANEQMDDQPEGAKRPERKDYRNQVEMESDGTIEMTNPNYVENDDVKNSMAEGYY